MVVQPIGPPASTDSYHIAPTTTTTTAAAATVTYMVGVYAQGGLHTRPQAVLHRLYVGLSLTHWDSSMLWCGASGAGDSHTS